MFLQFFIIGGLVAEGEMNNVLQALKLINPSDRQPGMTFISQ